MNFLLSFFFKTLLLIFNTLAIPRRIWKQHWIQSLNSFSTLMYGGIKLSNVTVGLPGNKCQLFISDFQLLCWVCVVWVVPQVWFPWLTAEHAILQGYIIYSSSYIYIQPRAARLSILCERISNVSSMMHLARVRSCPLFDGIQRREQ